MWLNASCRSRLCTRVKCSAYTPNFVPKCGISAPLPRFPLDALQNSQIAVRTGVQILAQPLVCCLKLWNVAPLAISREFSGACSASSSSGEDAFRRKNRSHFNGI